MDESPFLRKTLEDRSCVSDDTCELEAWETKEALLADGDIAFDELFLGSGFGGAGFIDRPLPRTLPPPIDRLGMVCGGL